MRMYNYLLYVSYVLSISNLFVLMLTKHTKSVKVWVSDNTGCIPVELLRYIGYISSDDQRCTFSYTLKIKKKSVDTVEHVEYNHTLGNY